MTSANSNFSVKRLRTTIALNQGAFDGQGSANTITLQGYRASASISNAAHSWGSQGKLYLSIWGMRDSLMQQMYKLSSMAQPDKITANLIRLEAASGDEQYQTVYEGMVYQCIPDYNEAPNVGVRIEATSAAWHMCGVPAANSGKGAHPVADVIEGLAKAMGFAFINNGVTATVTDYNVNGSRINQIRELARSVPIMCNIENGVVRIWPNGQNNGDPVIRLAPDTGLIGYPTMDYNGVYVNCLFNPEIDMGRQVQLDTSLTALTGTWYVLTTDHTLESEMPGGQWFTRAFMTRSPYFLSRNGN